MTRIPEIKSRRDNPTAEDVEYLLNENEILSQEIMRLREERKKVWDALDELVAVPNICVPIVSEFFKAEDLNAFQIFHVHADTGAKLDVRGEPELLEVLNEKRDEELERLREENARLLSLNICDICCGTGAPVNCACGGTGLMSKAVHSMREAWTKTSVENQALRRVLEEARNIIAFPRTIEMANAVIVKIDAILYPTKGGK